MVRKGEISPFLTMFSTAIYLKCIKMRHCVNMGCENLKSIKEV